MIGSLLKTGMRGARNGAMLGGARWGMRKFGGKLGRRGARMLGAAGWALPIGMAMLDQYRKRRARRLDHAFAGAD